MTRWVGVGCLGMAAWAATAMLPACRAQAAADQAATPASTISVQASLVIVPAVVRDKHGALVNDLGKDAFALTVDGQPQTLRYFDRDTDVPLTIGLLVDTSRSQSSVLDDEEKASDKFLQSTLAPAKGARQADKAFIMQFSRTAELLQDVTESRPLLAAGLKQIGTDPPGADRSDDDSSANNNGNNSGNNGNNGNNNGNGNNGRGGYSHSYRGGTALYDALFLASDEVIGKQTGRRALILLTDGVDSGSRETLAHAIEAAQRANTVVYAIYYKGQEPRQDYSGPRGGRGGYPGGGYPGGRGGGWPGGGGGQRNPNGNGGGRSDVDGRKILDRICGETGGRMFEMKGKDKADEIYAQIAEELRSQYRLGFTPGETAASPGYHPIQLTLTGDAAKRKLDVQTREGYYSGSRGK